MISALNSVGKGVELKKIMSRRLIKSIYQEKDEILGKILD